MRDAGVTVGSAVVAAGFGGLTAATVLSVTFRGELPAAFVTFLDLHGRGPSGSELR
jgi:hypothetical protein